MYSMLNPINKTTFLFLLSAHIMIIITQTSCQKLIEVNAPTTSITADNVYTNNLTASAVLTGIYSRISMNSITGNDLSAIGLITGLAGDELTLYAGAKDVRLRAYYQNNLATITSRIDFWANIYNEIYIANLSIERLNNSFSLTPGVRQQLLGEAKFIRAFCNFYLVNLYGDIPLVTTSNYAVNSTLPRAPISQVWMQIISDLKDAKILLSNDYVDGTLLKKSIERIRPNKWAATALLARSYLYTNDWVNAEIESTEIINNTTLYNLDSLNNTFLMNSREAIWQLQPVNFASNTEDAKVYILPRSGPSSSRPVYLSPQLLNSFEANDRRKTLWIDSVLITGIPYHFVFKYKSGALNAPLTEYNTIFRLGEQYLIRAEARAQQNKIAGSRADLNIIRIRAWLDESKLNQKSALLSSIYHERQVELFTEWGHRWLDMKRIHIVDTVMRNVTPLKGGSWNLNWELFPIPSNDILTNGNLSQNTGY
ncbi:RagB/SusD family nutrient uptake outer membrane protein [Chitinophaga sp. ARDCPP14]|uniref:RagB/SusD family nutrient uptake outer membrane protein n=1 Tax=Chitinophaga sp. ARDCPP14 TaxID=3391139 RepID=UPI003F5224CD